MRKIRGINMKTITQLKRKNIKNKTKNVGRTLYGTYLKILYIKDEIII